MVTKRCFLAIVIPELGTVYQQILDLSADLDVKCKPVKPNLYHFTLHFFGDLEDAQIRLVERQFEDFSFKDFQVQLGEPNFIPHNKPKNARVLYLAPIHGAYELQELAKSVASNLRQAKFDVKNKGLLPHLTVARIKFGKDRQKLVERWLNQEFSLPDFNVSSISLFESTLTSSGPIYDQISAFGN